MSLAILFALLAGLIVLEVPVAFALALSAILYLTLDGSFPLTIVVQRMAPGLDSYVLLAIPLFILAGNLLSRGGIATRIFDFAMTLVGHIRGSLALVNVVASMIFAGMSGVAQADAAGLGQIEVREMRRAGFSPAFAAAVSASSAIIGPIIPPSVIMVIYASLADVSVPDLFLAGILPGIVAGLAMMATIYFLAVTGRVVAPVRPRPSLAHLGRSFVRALPPLAAPVLLVGGILSGIATPTELGALTVLYAAVLGFIYRDLTVEGLVRAVAETVITMGALVFIIAAAVPFGWIVAVNDVPGQLAGLLSELSSNKYVILAIINIALLIFGCVMDTSAILLIAVPVLMPIVLQLGIDPIHFGIVVVINLLIGTTTPPFGILLFIMMDIAKISLQQLVRAMVPFYVCLLLFLIVITYVPQLSLALPQAIMGR
jgi:tripartite ATP-independent transporter DctM subunit